MTDVFLSYARADSSVADRLVRELNRIGVSVWYDGLIESGQIIVNEVEQALVEAKLVLVLVSPSSVESHWVRREWSSALAQSALIVPVFVGGVSMKEVPGPLANIQGVLLDGTKQQYAVAARLVSAAVARVNLSTEPPPRAVVESNRLIEDVTARVLLRLKKEQGQDLDREVESDPNLVFVITSFRTEMQPIYEAIQAAATAVGLRAERVKDTRGDYRITDRVLSMIRRARFVVADLTFERPNVYFELGYARGLGKTVVTIVREGTEIHFDVQDWVYIPYLDSRPLERNLIERFTFELEK